ncbi:hypothetical protein LUZ63_007797 [Rhynchospora breviuscula]|uniref:Protein kinase domain-containing protein n=1 Tax=Rhynchospora breviuscula TaxID=2022672 RepID=A0A9Q0HVD2_9POAL|nr:hypothetical protein LUZ63_007797 [Rhynchospora breviuscula]
MSMALSTTILLSSLFLPRLVLLLSQATGGVWLSKWSISSICGGVSLIAIIGFLSYLMCSRFGCCEEEEINSESEEEAGLSDPDDPDMGPTANKFIQQGGPLPSELESLEAFSLRDLKDATKNFSWFHRVGKGGFGAVYKGQLSDGRWVAVKRSQVVGVSKRDSVFTSEIKTQAKSEHINVLKVIGYCVEYNERIIVFEYMAQKDLYGHLYLKPWQKKSQVFRSWSMRVKILLDAGRGLNYLHQKGIVHRDIKSPNILIDGDLVGKISDFGGALVLAPGRTSVKVEGGFGTSGYIKPGKQSKRSMKPQKAKNKEKTVVDSKSDLYSFGVVMLEVITGKKAYRLRKEFLKSNSKVNTVLDQRLAKPVGDDKMKAIQRLMYVAKVCLQPTPEIDMMAIVGELESALTLFV